MNLTKEQIFMMYSANGYRKYYLINLNELLILRKFADMTEGEIGVWLNTDIDNPYSHTSECNRTVYLLSIGVDIFGAIEQGFAIREKELV